MLNRKCDPGSKHDATTTNSDTSNACVIIIIITETDRHPRFPMKNYERITHNFHPVNAFKITNLIYVLIELLEYFQHAKDILSNQC